RYRFPGGAGPISRMELLAGFASSAHPRNVPARSGGLAGTDTSGDLFSDLLTLRLPRRWSGQVKRPAGVSAAHAFSAGARGRAAHLSERLVRMGPEPAGDLVPLRADRRRPARGNASRQSADHVAGLTCAGLVRLGVIRPRARGCSCRARSLRGEPRHVDHRAQTGAVLLSLFAAELLPDGRTRPGIG